ncbi:hypothetical protein SAMN02746095_02940 [Acidocella aminolytica 101 = DSM 11237]|uniref:Uncharacterized protein n=1 Tax=Acidocella aminolytica 101 = DSM 11237 TaxID=1120923 RepID=A0A0D6PDQ8_9PROT|nr:hypothetical protein Aam_030_025 [Acidocella aminolytica 101 = DSM 11237]GBQ32064.1 hypothetical protein AA11237_0060 [Acidocella aminolytica 101 = DSM 11237]SHF35503.1 hypothetical protein SAMN02746095_02940 [Acidocella aminolytica 101 = DSM 11237]
MRTRAILFVRGDVIARGSARRVVWGVTSDRLVAFPLIPSDGATYRNAVSFSEISDVAAMGCGKGDLAIRPAVVASASTAGWKKVGEITASRLQELESAVKRAVVEESTVARWSKAPKKVKNHARRENLRTAEGRVYRSA